MLDKMTKQKLTTFNITNRSTQIRLKENIVELKEEKRSMTRFVTASRSRDDIDLPYIFGKS